MMSLHNHPRIMDLNWSLHWWNLVFSRLIGSATDSSSTCKQLFLWIQKYICTMNPLQFWQYCSSPLFCQCSLWRSGLSNFSCSILYLWMHSCSNFFMLSQFPERSEATFWPLCLSFMCRPSCVCGMPQYGHTQLSAEATFFLSLCSNFFNVEPVGFGGCNNMSKAFWFLEVLWPLSLTGYHLILHLCHPGGLHTRLVSWVWIGGCSDTGRGSFRGIIMGASTLGSSAEVWSGSWSDTSRGSSRGVIMGASTPGWSAEAWSGSCSDTSSGWPGGVIMGASTPGFSAEVWSGSCSHTSRGWSRGVIMGASTPGFSAEVWSGSCSDTSRGWSGDVIMGASTLGSSA